MFCVLCFRIWYFRGLCSRVCLLQNFLTDYGGAIEREEGAVELGSLGSYGIGFEKGEEEVGLIVVVPAVLTVIVVVVTRIIFDVCEYLLRYMFAPLFGAYLQTFIQLVGGIFGQLFVAVLSIVNGSFGGLIGYTIAPIIGADTTYIKDFIGNDTEAPQGVYTIQNKGLTTLYTGSGLTNFIGPSGGTCTITPIIIAFLYRLNGYPGFAPGVRLTTPTTVPKVEGIKNIFAAVSTPNATTIDFECESPYGVILATNNIEMIGLFETLHSVFDTTNYGDIGHILSPYPTRNGVEFLGVFNEMNDSKINDSEIYENEMVFDILNYENKMNENKTILNENVNNYGMYFLLLF